MANNIIIVPNHIQFGIIGFIY